MSAFGSPVWIRQNQIRSCRMRIRWPACSGSLHHRTLNDDAVADKLPQRDKELSRQGDNRRLLPAAAIALHAFLEPQAQLRRRLVLQPQPRKLDHGGSQLWIAGLGHALTWDVSPSRVRVLTHRVIFGGVQTASRFEPVSVLAIPNQNNLTFGRRTWQPHHNPASGGQGSGGRNHSYVRLSKP